MRPDQFVYWLQGFFEMTDAESLTPKQILLIKQHLGYVFANKEKDALEDIAQQMGMPRQQAYEGIKLPYDLGSVC